MHRKLPPTHRILKATTAMAVAALLALAPAVALAQPESIRVPETASAKVSLADLDLTTPQAESVARRRLTATAARLCRKFGDTRRISNAATISDCTRDAVNDAMQRINVRQLAKVE
jgi:UrcA family protein